MHRILVRKFSDNSENGKLANLFLYNDQIKKIIENGNTAEMNNLFLYNVWNKAKGDEANILRNCWDVYMKKDRPEECRTAGKNLVICLKAVFIQARGCFGEILI